MSVVSLKSSNGSTGNYSNDWGTKLLCSSSSASPSPLQITTKATNSETFNAENLPGGQESIDLVSKQPKTEQGISLKKSKSQIT